MSIEKIDFAADHHAPAHPKVMEALVASNTGIEHSYGEDSCTKRAEEAFKGVFGPDTKVYFLAGGGTGANILALGAALLPFQSVICSDVAHLYNDEAGAPEYILRCQLIPVATERGKIKTNQLAPVLGANLGDYHRSQPKVISVTQATERGTVYTPDEIRAITDLAHRNGLMVHMDGARLFNAAAFLGQSLRDLTTDLGVDILSLGCGKNGGLGVGEAVVFLNPNLGEYFENSRKQSMQLSSKGRFLAAQWLAMFEDDLWLKNATHANEMAKLLAEGIQDLPYVTLNEEVQTNGVWAKLPKEVTETLKKKYDFYVWGDPANNEVRLMTSYITTEGQVRELTKSIQEL